MMPWTSRLTHHLADDPAAVPADRLEGPELAHPAGDRGDGEQHGQDEGGQQHRDGEPEAQRVGQVGGGAQRARDVAGQVRGVVTVADGSSFWISVWTVEMSRVGGGDVDGVDVAGVTGSVWASLSGM